MSDRRHTSTLFPYTTLFRSHRLVAIQRPVIIPVTAYRKAYLLSLYVVPVKVGKKIPHEILLHNIRCVARRCPRRSEEHTSELQSRPHLVCRLLLEKKKPLIV